MTEPDTTAVASAATTSNSNSAGGSNTKKQVPANSGLPTPASSAVEILETGAISPRVLDTSFKCSDTPSVSRQAEFTYKRPSSLFADRSLKRRKLERLEQVSKTSLPPSPKHFCGLPIPETKFGVCGGCGENGEDEDETILLCDGEG